MPITVTAPRGVLTRVGELDVLPQLTAALIEVSGGTGNSFFTPLVGGTVHVLEPERIYAGGTNRPVVMVELKLPNIGLPTTGSRATFIAAATDIVLALSEPGHTSENVWVNILNAPDGAWGFGGRSWTGDELIAATIEAAAGTGPNPSQPTNDEQ